jgi:hypothetical protein
MIGMSMVKVSMPSSGPEYEFLHWAKGEEFKGVAKRSRELRHAGNFEVEWDTAGCGLKVAHNRTRYDYKTFTMAEGDLVIFSVSYVFHFYRDQANAYPLRSSLEPEFY